MAKTFKRVAKIHKYIQMFTLRIIEETRENENAPYEQVVENHSLGKSYAKLKQGMTKEFDVEVENLKVELKEAWPEVDIKKEVDMLICGENGQQFFIMKDIPTKRHDYFIMSESGKTFEKL